MSGRPLLAKRNAGGLTFFARFVWHALKGRSSNTGARSRAFLVCHIIRVDSKWPIPYPSHPALPELVR
jgi:hypothetical protein